MASLPEDREGQSRVKEKKTCSSQSSMSASLCSEEHDCKSGAKSHEERLFQHGDISLQAILFHDVDSGIWVIEYYRDHKQYSAALYLSEATAILMLQSLGYSSMCKLVS